MADKALFLPVHPHFAQMIVNGEKTLELRSVRPAEKPPFRVYIYETMGKSEIPLWHDEDGHLDYRGRGRVIGECECTRIDYMDYDSHGGFYCSNGIAHYIDAEDDFGMFESSRVTREELMRYTRGKRPYGLRLRNAQIYACPLNISEFGLKRVPQSWCYVNPIITPVTIPF